MNYHNISDACVYGASLTLFPDNRKMVVGKGVVALLVY